MTTHLPHADSSVGDQNDHNDKGLDKGSKLLLLVLLKKCKNLLANGTLWKRGTCGKVM